MLLSLYPRLFDGTTKVLNVSNLHNFPTIFYVILVDFLI